jgi:putative ABC transport system ATP-binding protein
MDKGEIILDVREKKSELTVDKLVERFHTIRHHSLESDEVRLSEAQ